jgi:hypothetical protein
MISCSNSGDYEVFSSGMWRRKSRKPQRRFWKNVLPLFQGSKSKPKVNQQEAGGKQNLNLKMEAIKFFESVGGRVLDYMAFRLRIRYFHLWQSSQKINKVLLIMLR